jgi:hypothetical protein
MSDGQQGGQEAGTAEAAPHERAETNRDRVRRLLFAPLGFRWPKGHDAERGRAALDALADELGYMSDEALAVLARMMRVHGQGSARCFWPDRASFLGFAHLVQPLPLTEDPKLLSWFASIEGQRMVAEGTLVETYRYFERRRVPPATPEARRVVEAEAREAARRLEVIDGKRRYGVEIAAAERDWELQYLGLRARLEEMVRIEAEKRGRAA